MHPAGPCGEPGQSGMGSGHMGLHPAAIISRGSGSIIQAAQALDPRVLGHSPRSPTHSEIGGGEGKQESEDTPAAGAHRLCRSMPTAPQSIQASADWEIVVVTAGT